MSYIDLIIIVILGINIFQGIRRGLISIIMDTVGILGSIFIAVYFYSGFSSFLQYNFSLSSKLADITSFLGFWIVFFILITAFGRVLNTVFSGSILGPINWAGGGLIGFIRGVFFLLLIIIPLFLLDVKFETNSILLDFINPFIDSLISNFLPENSKSI